MIQQTSIEAYHQIKEKGLLSKLRFEVYETLFFHGSMTQGECWKNHFPNRQRHDVCPRFAELERRGVIRCVGERPCAVTGRNAMVWELTNRLPISVRNKRRVKCEHCEGKGTIEVEDDGQMRLL